MNIYIAKEDTFPGLKEIKIEHPPQEELLNPTDMIGSRNANYGGVCAYRGVYGKDHPRYGTKQSQKQKDAMSKARKGVKHSEETKAKMKKAWKKRKKTFVSPFIEYHKYRRALKG